MLSLMAKAVNNPRQIPSKGMARYRKNRPILSSLIGQGRFLEAVLYALNIVDLDLYSPYIARMADADGHVLTPVLSRELYIDPLDTGISHELYATGSHEPKTTECFAGALKALRRNVDGPVTVLEIGANLGYYILVEAEILGDDAQIYAVEPAPTNAALARKNIAHNGLDSIVNFTGGAIGRERGETDLHLSEHSNKHAIFNVGKDRTGETVAVETWDIQSFLDAKGLDAESVNVVRLDVEGYELQVLRGGLASFFEEAAQPLVVCIEVHGDALTDAEIDEIVSTLEREFALLGGYQHTSQSECLAEVNAWDDARELGWAELVLVKSFD